MTRIVESTIKYLGSFQGKPIFHERRRDLDNLPLENLVVRVEDVRPSSDKLSLDREGFVLVPHRSAVRNFFDPAAVRDIYGRELAELLKQVTGASKVVVSTGPTGGVVRRSERSPRFGQDHTTVPGRFAHCDFSPNPAGSIFWVEQMLPPDEAKERLARRFAIYNLWRVLSDPPQDVPLAVCDARSVAPLDRVCSDCVVDPVGGPDLRFENSMFRYDSDHRWCYFSNMTRDEVLVFKGFDSDPNRAAGIPHAAFDDPSCPPTAPARQSIDVRAFAFFNE